MRDMYARQYLFVNFALSTDQQQRDIITTMFSELRKQGLLKQAIKVQSTD